MNSIPSDQTIPFQLQGQFVGFIYKSNGQSKSLILAVGERQLRVKIDKSLRDTQALNILPGDWISITGEQEFKGQNIRKDSRLRTSLETDLIINYKSAIKKIGSKAVIKKFWR